MAWEVTMVELVEALDQEFEKLRQDAAGRAQEAAKGAAFVGKPELSDSSPWGR